VAHGSRRCIRRTRLALTQALANRLKQAHATGH
jgi:hypothetical protein